MIFIPIQFQTSGGIVPVTRSVRVAAEGCKQLVPQLRLTAPLNLQTRLTRP